MGVLQGVNGRISPKIPLFLLSEDALEALSTLLFREESAARNGAWTGISLSRQNLLLPAKPSTAERFLEHN